MKCKSIDKKLVLYLEGGLSDAEHQIVSQHIALCADCAAKVNYLRTSFQWLETVKATEVKPFLFTRIQARMESRNQTVRRWTLAPLAVASVLFVGLLIGSVAGRFTIQQGTTLVPFDHSVAYLFNDADLESTELKLLNN